MKDIFAPRGANMDVTDGMQRNTTAVGEEHIQNVRRQLTRNTARFTRGIMHPSQILFFFYYRCPPSIIGHVSILIDQPLDMPQAHGSSFC